MYRNFYHSNLQVLFTVRKFNLRGRPDDVGNWEGGGGGGGRGQKLVKIADG